VIWKKDRGFIELDVRAEMHFTKSDLNKKTKAAEYFKNSAAF